MRMCREAQGAYSHQPSTGKKAVEALDPPEPSPWMLTRGMPYLTPCLAAGPARYVEFDGTQLSIFCITTYAQKQAYLWRYAPDGHDLPSPVAHATDLPAPFRTAGFALKGTSCDDGRFNGRYESDDHICGNVLAGLIFFLRLTDTQSAVQA